MQGKKGNLLTVLILSFTAFIASAQEAKISSGFVEDSLMIGQEIHYWMTVDYPLELDVVFPDSTFDFSPFEWVSKQYFPSTLLNNFIHDSVIYTLQSYEIEAVQKLKLEALFLVGADTVYHPTPIDSIFFKDFNTMVTDTTSLKKNVAYHKVGLQFNYPLFYYVVAGLVVILLLIILIFGKKIIRFFKLKKLSKEYKLFSEELDEYVTTLRKNPTPEIAERAVTLWKTYQQKLEKKAFTTFTTKEILELTFTEELKNPLRVIDRTIYGNVSQPSLYQEFQLLENFAHERYTIRVDKIRYGK